AIARPPPASISRATAVAGPSSEPTPSVVVPRSFTTTAAPSSASIEAVARPMPRPAPVTTAVRPKSGVPGVLMRPLYRRRPDARTTASRGLHIAERAQVLSLRRGQRLLHGRDAGAERASKCRELRGERRAIVLRARVTRARRSVRRAAALERLHVARPAPNE